MATAACTINGIAYYAGSGRIPSGVDTFSSPEDRSTYVGKTSDAEYTTIIKFTAPSVAGTLAGGTVTFTLPIVIGSAYGKSSVTVKYAVSSNGDGAQGGNIMPAGFAGGTVTFAGLTASIKNMSFTCPAFNPTPGGTVWYLWLTKADSAVAGDLVQIYKGSNHAATLNYTAVTAAGAPTACSVSATLAERQTTLSWSGASAGVGNSITGYQIQYRDSPDNSSWGAWTVLSTVSMTAASGSLTVDPPATRGYYRQYQVRTLGSAGSGYYSAWRVSSNTLRRNTLPGAPTSAGYSKATVNRGDSITLSWSGASAGTSAIAKYILQYRTSPNASAWSAWTTYSQPVTSAASGSITWTETASPLLYVQWQILTQDALGAQSAWKAAGTYTIVQIACGAPTACAVSAELAEGSATLSWSGASAGGTDGTNTITGYEVQFRDSPDNSAWGAWTAAGTVSAAAASGSLTVAPPSARGHYRQFQVRTLGSAGSGYYSAWLLSSNTLRKNTLPAAPDTFTASPASYTSDGSITLAWSGIAPGTSALAQAEISKCTSAGGSAWGSWSVVSAVGTTDTSGSASDTAATLSGTCTRYRIRVKDSLGAWSASYTESNSVYCDYTSVGAPTACSLAATLSETAVLLSWSGASAGYGNAITGYEVQYRDSADGSAWGEWMNSTTVANTAASGSLTVSPPAFRGYCRQFRVRTLGSAGSGYCSGWILSGNTLRRNQAPAVPLLAPTGGGSSFNPRPFVLGTADTEPDGNVQTLKAAFGTQAIVQQAIASAGQAFAVRPAANISGQVQVTIYMTDSFGVNSGSSIRTIKVDGADFSAIIPGKTRVRAAHVTELRSAIDKLRLYYGLGAYSWTPITPNVTSTGDWATHVLELRAAIGDIIQTVNTFAAGSIPAPAYTDISDGVPKAAALTELQQLLLTL
ncbi:MAG: fibronectin type III domain-containing protein [Oscillospiraceae bacterium]|nr:fibronectin type III domain-containing protein [Oscillospiraceae bacterium]